MIYKTVAAVIVYQGNYMIDLNGECLDKEVFSVEYLNICRCLVGIQVDFKTGGVIRIISDADNKPDFIPALGMKLVNINTSTEITAFSFFDGEDKALTVLITKGMLDAVHKPCKFSCDDEESNSDGLREALKAILQDQLN